MTLSKTDIKKLYNDSNIPEFYRNYKFGTHYDTGSKNWQKVADNVRSEPFTDVLRFKIVTGEHNVGKTVMLSCLIAEACRNGKNAIYVKEDDLINHKYDVWTEHGQIKVDLPLPLNNRCYFDENQEHQIKKVDAILFFDELGCRQYINNTSFKYDDLHNRMNNYIDKILNNNVYVVFASNYGVDKIKERVGQKFWARIEKGGYKCYEI